MSGKFHSAWGEFGGFKHRDALLYEAASMVAFGAHVNIGDQLHPSGKMDMSTYENIGYAFDYVEEIEAYGVGALHSSRLGYFNPFREDFITYLRCFDFLSCHYSFFSPWNTQIGQVFNPFG